MKYFISILLIITVAFIAISFRSSNQIEYPSIENIHSVHDAFAPYIESETTAGVSIGIYNKGEVEYFHFGETKKGNGIIPSENNIYEIGSISKTFTGALLAELEKEGAVKFTDHISTYLPDGTCPWKDEVEPITLEDLSKHNSGFPRLPKNLMGSYIKDMKNPYAAYSHELLFEGVQELTKSDLESKKHLYSNFGAGLLGEILARTQKSSYGEPVNNKIFTKLNMSNSFVDVPNESQSAYTTGHDYNGNETSHWDLPSLAGAGAIKSTISDMMLYMKANMNSDSPFDKTHAYLTDLGEGESIGLGWYIQKNGDDKTIWHNGGTGGFSSMMMMDKEKQLGIVVLSNSAVSVDQPSALSFKYLKRNK